MSTATDIAALKTAVAALKKTNTAQETEIGALKKRCAAIEAVNTAQAAEILKILQTHSIVVNARGPVDPA
jgi:hypothetical protein